VGSFKPYLLGATVFAAALTALALNEDIASFIGQFDLLVFVPIMMAILIGGNVHMPSALGAYLGFFIQWFVVGIAVGAVIWAITKRKTDAATRGT
jgi:hypothetical protein